jgi:hypothetical protein
MAEKNKFINKKRLSKSQRTHARRLKQEARKDPTLVRAIQ